LQLLAKIIDYLDKGFMPFYWEKKNNMLGSMNDVERLNYAGFLKNFVKKFDANRESNPAVIEELICNYYFLHIPITYLIKI
jgi:hypothetical protein